MSVRIPKTMAEISHKGFIVLNPKFSRASSATSQPRKPAPSGRQNKELQAALRELGKPASPRKTDT